MLTNRRDEGPVNRWFCDGNQFVVTLLTSAKVGLRFSRLETVRQFVSYSVSSSHGQLLPQLACIVKAASLPRPRSKCEQPHRTTALVQGQRLLGIAFWTGGPRVSAGGCSTGECHIPDQNVSPCCEPSGLLVKRSLQQQAGVRWRVFAMLSISILQMCFCISLQLSSTLQAEEQ